MYTAFSIGSWSRRLAWVAVAICLLAVPSVASAASSSWDGGSPLFTNTWSDLFNWSPDGVPAATDDVTIGAIASFCLLNVDATVNNLTLTGTAFLYGTGATSNLTVNGALSSNNGTIGTDFGQTVRTTTLNGASTLTNALTLGRNIANNGTASIVSGSTMARQGGVATSLWTNGAAGTLRKTSANSGTSTIQWDVANGGILRADAGTLSVTGAFSQTSGGTTVAASGATVNLGGGALGVTVQGGLSGSGTITAGSGGISHSSGSIAPGMSAGTLTIGTGLTLAGTSVLNFEFGAAGAGFDDRLVVNGNLTLPTSATPITLNIQGLPTDISPRLGEMVTLIDYSGTLTGDASSFVIGSIPVGATSQYIVSIDTVGTRVMLELPEPSTVVFGISLGLMGLVLVWRKRSAAR